ncbi:TlpA disulfide reductase family protein [uncultured Cohaesibacter sp.]|uniref:TlpA disulfide reductase family protein n=1 Tax=uncultured Cohaesibacter sp. TaxID=1002546 RepID=UPI0029301B80|nr:TlpA disulfide reductase family protein [uncultured Cohaesibacter sp.]
MYLSSIFKVWQICLVTFVSLLILVPSMAFAQGSCSASKARISAIEPLIAGPIAGLQTEGHPVDLSGFTFKRGDGAEIQLADFGGKTVLLNIWATWCAPCREEMPDLDALQSAVGGDGFEVVAVSMDRKAPSKPKAFFEETGIRDLSLYYDEKMALFNGLRAKGMAFGMPSTVLIDADGCSLAHMAGPARWAADEMKALVEKLKDGGSGQASNSDCATPGQINLLKRIDARKSVKP